MPHRDDFPALVESLYAAAADASRWPAALGQIQRAFAAHSAALTFQHPSGRAGTRIASGYQPGDEKRYFAGYSVQNLLYEALLNQGAGKPVPTHDHVDLNAMERTAYYAEWLRPRDIYFCFGLVLSQTDAQTEWLSINRSKQASGFTETGVRFMQRLTPHLQRAVSLTRPRSSTPLIAVLTPLLAKSETWLPNNPAVAVLLNDPARPRELPRETLRTTFSLTPAESKLATLLANGHPLAEAADTLHITRETARTHLARTLSKTGTRRQAELIRLLLNLSPGLIGTEN